MIKEHKKFIVTCIAIYILLFLLYFFPVGKFAIYVVEGTLNYCGFVILSLVILHVFGKKGSS